MVSEGTRATLSSLNRLHLIMGLQCNVRCSMCYQTDFSAKTNMPAELWRYKLESVYPHVDSVKLQGGEPTVMKNCREAAAYLRQFSKLKLEIISNGVFLDDFWEDSIVHQGSLYSVSIQGATRSVYDSIVKYGKHDRVIKNLERILTQRQGETPRVVLTAVVQKDNFHDLAEIILLGGRLGVDGIEFGYDPILTFQHLPNKTEVLKEVDRCRNAAALYPRLEIEGLEPLYQHVGETKRGSEASKAMCSAPFANMVVDWDGTVRVCCNTWVKAGNLYESSAESIWSGAHFERFRHKMKANDYSWCIPDCPANANPSRLSLPNKYLYQLKSDPAQFARKVKQKIARSLASRRKVSQ